MQYQVMGPETRNTNGTVPLNGQCILSHSEPVLNVTRVSNPNKTSLLAASPNTSVLSYCLLVPEEGMKLRLGRLQLLITYTIGVRIAQGLVGSVSE